MADTITACSCCGLTLVPDGVLGGVDLWLLMLLNPGQSCSSSSLGSFTGNMTIILGTGAALNHLLLLTTVLEENRNVE